MSPRFVIDRFQKIIGTFGTDVASSGRFKQEREAWISAVWSLGLGSSDGREYWTEIETREQTPDCRVHMFDQTTGDNNLKTFNLEIAEWEEHVEDIRDIIRSKCTKAYPKYFFLIVLARNGGSFSAQVLQEMLKGLKVPFAEIWILGRPSPLSNLYQMLLTYPYQKLMTFDLGLELKRARHSQELLVRQKRGRGTALENLGSIYLPIPLSL